MYSTHWMVTPWHVDGATYDFIGRCCVTALALQCSRCAAMAAAWCQVLRRRRRRLCRYNCCHSSALGGRAGLSDTHMAFPSHDSVWPCVLSVCCALHSPTVCNHPVYSHVRCLPAAVVCEHECQQWGHQALEAPLTLPYQLPSAGSRTGPTLVTESPPWLYKWPCMIPAGCTLVQLSPAQPSSSAAGA